MLVYLCIQLDFYITFIGLAGTFIQSGITLRNKYQLYILNKAL